MATLSRRKLIEGIGVGIPLAAILADPLLARAAASELENVSISTASGKKVNAAMARPDAKKAPAVLLVHEWWGLNDQIKSVAREFANLGYLALAIDLYDGNVTANPEQARAYMQATNGDEARETVAAWGKWLLSHPTATGKAGSVGWCFGGGWSLNAALASPLDCAVVYYGRVDKKASELAPLKGPVLGHFATRDQWINKKMVDGFSMEMKKADKPFFPNWYEADHAFANPTGARYDRKDAQLAWQRTTDFFAKYLH